MAKKKKKVKKLSTREIVKRYKKISNEKSVRLDAFHSRITATVKIWEAKLEELQELCPHRTWDVQHSNKDVIYEYCRACNSNRARYRRKDDG